MAARQPLSAKACLKVWVIPISGGEPHPRALRIAIERRAQQLLGLKLDLASTTLDAALQGLAAVMDNRRHFAMPGPPADWSVKQVSAAIKIHAGHRSFARERAARVTVLRRARSRGPWALRTMQLVSREELIAATRRSYCIALSRSELREGFTSYRAKLATYEKLLADAPLEAGEHARCLERFFGGAPWHSAKTLDDVRGILNYLEEQRPRIDLKTYDGCLSRGAWAALHLGWPRTFRLIDAVARTTLSPDALARYHEEIRDEAEYTGERLAKTVDSGEIDSSVPHQLAVLHDLGQIDAVKLGDYLCRTAERVVYAARAETGGE